MEKEQIIKALECCIEDKCENCPYDEQTACREYLLHSALALIKSQDEQIFQLENRLKECENGYSQTLGIERARVKELTEENERLKKDNEYILMQHAFQRRPSGDCWNDVIKKVQANTVREIFKEIYSSLDYIEEQMEPEEIPECFFSVREDINALKEKFESEGAADEI